MALNIAVNGFGTVVRVLMVNQPTHGGWLSPVAHDPQSDEVPTISALVKRRLDQGDSARAMALRAEKAGFTIRHQTISTLAAAAPKSWPEPSTMQALAYLLDTSERHILLSFGRTFGLSVETVSVADLIPPEFGELPDEVQTAAVRMLRAIAATVGPTSKGIPEVPPDTLDKPNTIVGPTNTRSEQSTSSGDT